MLLYNIIYRSYRYSIFALAILKYWTPSGAAARLSVDRREIVSALYINIKYYVLGSGFAVIIYYQIYKVIWYFDGLRISIYFYGLVFVCVRPPAITYLVLWYSVGTWTIHYTYPYCIMYKYRVTVRKSRYPIPVLL